jgi:cation:H+ antiporter
MILWLQFVICATVILFAGANLSRYGDIIAEKTGMGRTWIGVVLMASVTSLPELITGMSSVVIFDVPDIAAGDVLGSCMFNILIIAFLDLICGPTPISGRVHQGQILTAAFGMLLLGIVAMSLLAGDYLPSIGWIGASSFVLIAIYLLSMRTVFLYERRRIAEFIEEMAEEVQYDHISTQKAYGMYGLNALIIIVAATYLPSIGAEIAVVTGLGQSFVGNVLIALSTSLPELVVSIAALRINAVDMAVGNLFGSNLFNICILALDDIAYTKGPLLSTVAAGNVITAVAAITITTIAVIGLTYRVSKKAWLVAWDSMGIAATYILATFVLYLTRGSG